MSCLESCKSGRDLLVVEDFLPPPQPQLQSLNLEQQRALGPWIRKISSRRRLPVLADTFSSVIGKWAFNDVYNKISSTKNPYLHCILWNTRICSGGTAEQRTSSRLSLAVIGVGAQSKTRVQLWSYCLLSTQWQTLCSRCGKSLLDIDCNAELGFKRSVADIWFLID